MHCSRAKLRRSRFTDSHAHLFLSLVIPVVYGSANEGHTSLGVVYDMIWSHSEFFAVMCSPCDRALKGNSLLWNVSLHNVGVLCLESLVRLLITIVELDPSVCRTSHVLVLLGAYSATRTRAG